MRENAAAPPPKFDAYAAEYAALLETSLRDSGEPPEYFAEYKLRCLLRLGAPRGRPILDFGAGVGSLTERLSFEFDDITAYEPSPVSLEHARRRVPDARCVGTEDDLEPGHFATAVCAGVIHHVSVGERREVLSRLRTKLMPGGRLFLFEHNPLNPFTRRSVARCPFDDDAVLLYPWELRPLLVGAGFLVERVDYIVFFPRLFAQLRPLEPMLRRVVLGAQTLTVARNPG